MVKNKKYDLKGMNRDINPGRHPDTYLYEANNMRYLTTTTPITGGIAFEKGNSLAFEIPDITINQGQNRIAYGNSGAYLTYKNGGEIDTDTSIPSSSTTQTIVGHTVTRDSIVVLTTDGLGMDCIWTVSNEDYTVTLKYLRNLGWTKERPIQALFNYENENIQKVYWVDGEHQIRFINLEHESIDGNGPLIDIPSEAINFVGVISFSQPTISSVGGGGSHTSGMIQYAYNLYRLNSSQTKPSPLSELIPLDKTGNLGGGALDEQVGAAPIVNIDNIDTDYTHIKVYAIKYTSLNQTPSINLIEERELNGQTSITVYDDGSTISSLSLEEFLFLGSDPYVPQHIESKDNTLFLFNVQEREFVLPDELDTRAYSFPITSTSTTVYDNVTSNSAGNPTGDATTVDNNYTVGMNNDAVNLDYDNNKYKYNSSILGGSGKFVEYRINTTPTLDNDVSTYRFFKYNEIYRIGIQFYNRLGQVSTPKWIADFKSPANNLNNLYGTLEVSLTSNFTSWLSSYDWESDDDIPVGYKIIRADRTLNDKTIICQGVLSGMMVNSPRDSEGVSLYTTSEKRVDSDNQVKMPNFLMRTFEEITPLQGNEHLKAMQLTDGGTTNPLTEVQYDASERKADTYQYTTMYQMYSPEIMFGDVSLNSSLKFNVIGGLSNDNNDYWGQERLISSQTTETEGKALGAISPYGGGTNININGSATDLMDRGLISDTNGSTPDERVEFNQWYREFNTFQSPDDEIEYYIYGTPELTIRGQGTTTYNNNTKYEYTNTLEGFLSDGEDEFDEDGQNDRAIISINSYGAQCITFMWDNGSQTDVNSYSRAKLETLYSNSGLSDDSVVLISELVKPSADVYLSAIYGGNTYEDKKRTNYLEIGEYQDISTTTVQINSPGDTYISEYKFMRIGKTDTEIYSAGVNQLTELVSVMVETSINLDNRNDTSFSSWDSDFQPQYDEYHEYNTVYSQQPTLVQNTDTDFTFRAIKNFDTRIQATQVKTPNENIDSWTDILSDEVLDLDGKYGPINGVISFRDNIYTFQDNALALIGINPRVQTQATDGISIELGTGNTLYDYQYISTKTGCINKWGMVASESGIYFLDGLNKRFYRYTNQLEPLSELKGFHEYLETSLNRTYLIPDNPLLNAGVSMGYDQKNNDIYLTYRNSWTLAFNELMNEFTSFYSYNSPIYIWNKEKLLTVSPLDQSEAWEVHSGDYNSFYNTNYNSNITFIANPEPDHEVTFNNLEWKSVSYPGSGSISLTSDVDYAWEKVAIWNEFQSSGLIDIEKIRKLNRKYRMSLPRNAGSRDRIRNNWAFVKLQSSNEDGNSFVMQPIVLYYTPNYIVIQ